MNIPSNESSSLACDLTAIPSEAREEHVTTAPQLFALSPLNAGTTTRFSMHNV